MKTEEIESDDPFAGAENSTSGGSRPKITFMNMIASAISASPQKKLSLQEIYHYIMEHYGHFYNFENRKAWQNAVRHNLSLHECFVKIRRPARIVSGGKVYETTAHGCYWALDELASREFETHGRIKRRASARIAKMRNTESPPDASNSKRRGRPVCSSFRDPQLPLPIAPPLSPQLPLHLRDFDYGTSPPQSPHQSEMTYTSCSELQDITRSPTSSRPPPSLLAQSSQEIRRLYLEVRQMYDLFV
jgi:hypothetical protein